MLLEMLISKLSHQKPSNGRSAAISIFNEIKQERRGRSRSTVARGTVISRQVRPSAKAEPVRRPTKPTTAKEEPSSVLSYIIIGTIACMLLGGGVSLYALLQPGEAGLPVEIEVQEKPVWITKPLK